MPATSGIVIRVLVIEEDSSMRDKLVEVLQAEGFVVESAATGASALVLLTQRHFDAVIANLRLHQMTGLETLERIKTRFPDLASLVIATQAGENDVLQALRAGTGDFLKRPFRSEDIVQSIHRQLRRRGQRAPQESPRGMLEMLLKAVESLARSVDASGTVGRPLQGMYRLGVLAGNLGRLLELDELSVQLVQLATWLEAFRALPGEAPLLVDEEDLPQRLQSILRNLDQPWNELPQGEEVPLESRLVAVVLALGRGDDIRADSRFDPALVELLLHRSKELLQGNEAERQRNLLARASALELSGQSKEARRLFEQALKADSSSADGIEAALGLARVTQSEDWVHQAVQSAQKIGPWLNAETCLRGALLMGAQPVAAKSLLQRSARLYRDLQFRSGEALATLAQQAFTEEPPGEELLRSSLLQLCSEAERDALFPHWHWLLPIALQRVEEDREGPMFRWLRSCLEEDGPWLAQQSWSEDSALAWIRLLVRLPWTPGEYLQSALSQHPSEAVRKALREATLSVGSALPPLLRVSTLGRFEVQRGHQTLPNNLWRSQKGKWIFAFLAAHPHLEMPQEEVVELFWPDDVERGRTLLDWVVDSSAATLRPALPGGAEADYLLLSEGRLRLNPQLPRWSDLEELDSAASAAQQQQGNEAARHHRRVVALYRGHYLQGQDFIWARPIRHKALLKVCDSLEWLAQWSLKSGRPAAALEHGLRLCDYDPGRDRAWVCAMEALLALNRVDETLRLFDRCKSAQDREPSEAVRAVQRRAIASLTQ